MAVITYKKSDRTMLSKNFGVPEFSCHGQGCCDITLIDTDLVAIEQDMRDHFGAPVTNTSAYRCPVHNRNVGGATGSRHTKGQAADFVVAGHAPRECAQYLESRGVMGIGLYESRVDGYFVHVDTRTVKSYWYGQAQAYRSTFGPYIGKPANPAKPSKPTIIDAADYSHEQFIRELQAAIGARVDGLAGPETLNMTPTLAAWRNISHPAVLPVQRYLKYLGYEVGDLDGVAGPKFTAAVKQFQTDTECKYKDGEITSKNETWKKILRLAA